MPDISLLSSPLFEGGGEGGKHYPRGEGKWDIIIMGRQSRGR